MTTSRSRSSVARLRVVDHPVYGRRLAVKTPYKPAFVETLKRAIGYPDRVWDRRRYVWLIALHYRDEVQAILKQHFMHGIYTDAICDDLPGDRRTREPPPRRESGRIDHEAAFRRTAAAIEDWKILEIDPAACIEVAEAAHKALIRKHHPDRGGDQTMMQLVNAAWTRVQKALKEAR